MISNQDNYLFLKQILAIIQAQRLNSEVELGSSLLDPESTRGMAKNKLIEIEEEYTIPRFASYSSETTIDFEKLIEAIKFWTADLREVDLAENEAMQLLLEVEKPDNFYRSVMDYPIIAHCIEEHKACIDDGTRFPISSQTLIDAANAVDDALILIKKWVTEDLSYISVAQLIVLLNCVQMLDEMFQFGNDRFIGC